MMRESHKNEICCKQFGEIGNLGINLDDTFVFDNYLGFSTIAFRCFVPTGGEITFEATFDGINWEHISVRSITDDIYVSKTTNGSDFVGSIAGARQFRFRTSVAGTVAGTVMGQAQRPVSVLEGIEFGYPPHRFGFAPVHKDSSFSTQQTNAVLWTPTLGKKFIITDMSIICGGTTDAVVTIFDETNVAGNIIFKGTIDVSNNKQYSYSHAFKTPYIGSNINNSLKITTSAAISIDIVLHGYEV